MKKLVFILRIVFKNCFQKNVIIGCLTILSIVNPPLIYSQQQLLYLKGGDPANWTETGIPGNQHEEITQWTNYGCEVQTMNLTTTSITSSLLSNYEVLRLNGELGPRALTFAEGGAIYSWVQDGGKLLADIAFTNQIPAISSFGVQTIEGENGGNTGLVWYFHGAPMVDGPITGPLSGVGSFASACMDHPVLTAENQLIVDYYKSGYPMIVHNQFGAGKVVIVFTNAWSHDQDWTTNAYRATIFEEDNIEFLQNCIEYFQTTTGTDDILTYKEDFTIRNYPNPFKTSTKIQITLNKPSMLSIDVFDLTGRKVNTLIDNKTFSQGQYEFEFSANQLRSGVYIYETKVGSVKSIGKMIKY